MKLYSTIFSQEILIYPFFIFSSYTEVALDFTVLSIFYSCSVKIACNTVTLLDFRYEVLVKDLTMEFVHFYL